MSQVRYSFSLSEEIKEFGGVKMRNNRFVILGIIRRSENHRGIRGLTVETYDADLFFDDKLGSCITDSKGGFQITYQKEDFEDLFEKRPDLYLVIRSRDGRKIHSTKRRIRFNAGREEYFLIELSSVTLGELPAEKTLVGGMEVDKQAFGQVEPLDLIALVKACRGTKLDEKRLVLFQRVNPSLVKPLIPDQKTLEKSLCLTPQITFIEAALGYLKAPNHIFDQLDIVLFDLPLDENPYETDHFKIHYKIWDGNGDWEADSDTILPTDSPAQDVHLYDADEQVIGSTTAGNGIPTYIQKLSIWLEYAYERYTQQYQMRDPRINGNKINVFVEYMEGALSGYGGHGTIGIDNDLDDADLASTSVHELFHCVQSEYLVCSGCISPFEDWKPFMTEGTTRVIEDTVNDSLNRWMENANWFFRGSNKQTSLPQMLYSGALFWKYMTEQHSRQITPAYEPAIGVDVIRKACELASTSGKADINVPISLRNQRVVPYFGTFSHFIYLPPGNVELSTNETTFGNWLATNYLQCLRNTIADRRFTYMEASEKMPGGAGMACMYPTSKDELGTETIKNLESQTVPWAAQYHQIKILEGVDTVKVSYTPDPDFVNPLVQLLLIDKDETLRDLIKFEKSFVKTINANDLDRIVVIAGARETGGDYSIRIEATEATSDVMITRWNSVEGQEHEFDPIGWSWHWISPDVWPDNFDGELHLADKNILHFEWDNPRGGSNHLYVRLRNKGTSRARNISVRFYFQDASAGLRDDAWQIMKADRNGTIAQITGLSVDPGEEIRPFVNWWLPRPDVEDENRCYHYCVKVEVESPLDVNADNKLAFSNFNFIEEKLPTVELPAFDVLIWDYWVTWKPFDPYWDIHKDFTYWKLAPLETYIIPRNNPSLLFNQRDFFSLRHVELRDIQAEPTYPSNEDIVRPPESYTFYEERKKRAVKLSSAKRVYRVRFVSQKSGKKTPPSPGLLFPVENAIPPDAKLENIQTSPDPRTIPPGLADVPMVTIVQVINGRIIGGLTYAIVKPDESHG